jgi:hypothetical protein
MKKYLFVLVISIGLGQSVFGQNVAPSLLETDKSGFHFKQNGKVLGFEKAKTLLASKPMSEIMFTKALNQRSASNIFLGVAIGIGGYMIYKKTQAPNLDTNFLYPIAGSFGLSIVLNSAASKNAIKAVNAYNQAGATSQNPKSINLCLGNMPHGVGLSVNF